jgi:hypothetical protein
MRLLDASRLVQAAVPELRRLGLVGSVFFRCRFERRIGGEKLSIGLGVSVQIQIESVMGAVNLEFQQTVKIPERILMLCGMGCVFLFA